MPENEPGRCPICDIYLKKTGQLFCWVHEPYQDAAPEVVQRARKAWPTEREADKRGAQ